MPNDSIKIEVREYSKPNTISQSTDLEKIFPVNELFKDEGSGSNQYFFELVVLFRYTYLYVCILSGFSFKDTDNSQGSRKREGTIFYSTLPLPPAHSDIHFFHEHSDIYLQLSA